MSKNILTAKQEAFVHCLIEGTSQRQSYRAAYDAKNMSDKTVDEAASKLLANYKVSARYEEIQAQLRDKADGESIATAAQVLEELTAIALGKKEYPSIDMFGNPVERPVSVTQRIKALELLGKKHKLFTDNINMGGETALDINIKVVE